MPISLIFGLFVSSHNASETRYKRLPHEEFGNKFLGNFFGAIDIEHRLSLILGK